MKWCCMPLSSNPQVFLGFTIILLLKNFLNALVMVQHMGFPNLFYPLFSLFYSANINPLFFLNIFEIELYQMYVMQNQKCIFYFLGIYEN